MVTGTTGVVAVDETMYELGLGSLEVTCDVSVGVNITVDESTSDDKITADDIIPVDDWVVTGATDEDDSNVEDTSTGVDDIVVVSIDDIIDDVEMDEDTSIDVEDEANPCDVDAMADDVITGDTDGDMYMDDNGANEDVYDDSADIDNIADVPIDDVVGTTDCVSSTVNTADVVITAAESDEPSIDDDAPTDPAVDGSRE